MSADEIRTLRELIVELDVARARLWRERAEAQARLAELVPLDLPKPQHQTDKQRKVARCPRCAGVIQLDGRLLGHVGGRVCARRPGGGRVGAGGGGAVTDHDLIRLVRNTFESYALGQHTDFDKRTIWQQPANDALAALDTLATHLRALEAAAARANQLEKALRRLASQEGFEGAGWVGGDSFAERELRARGRFAEEAIAGVPAEPAAEEAAVSDSAEWGSARHVQQAWDELFAAMEEHNVHKSVAIKAVGMKVAVDALAASSVSAGAGQVPADTIEKALEHYANEAHWTLAPDDGQTAEYPIYMYDGGNEWPWEVARAALAAVDAQEPKT